MTEHVTKRWQTLPATPAPLASFKGQHAPINGCSLYYTEGGAGDDVIIMLHGGMANSDYWEIQAAYLAKTHRVILVDSRGHGRSTLGDKPLSYAQMADDIIHLMNHLEISNASIVGWSDGGVQSIILASEHPDRIKRIFAYGAHMSASGLNLACSGDKVVNAFVKRATADYRKLSPTPDEFDVFSKTVWGLWKWEHDAEFTEDRLNAIRCPAWIVDGDRDEMIHRPHLEYLVAHIPDSSYMILPETSHFAFLQAPLLFNEALADFLSVKA